MTRPVAPASCGGGARACARAFLLATLPLEKQGTILHDFLAEERHGNSRMSVDMLMLKR